MLFDLDLTESEVDEIEQNASEKKVHILSDFSQSPAKVSYNNLLVVTEIFADILQRTRPSKDDTYKDDPHSSEEFYGSSDVAESSGSDDNIDETRRLGRPVMMEAKEELDDHHHESEDEDGNYIVKRGGVPEHIVKSGALKDIKAIGIYQQKRYFIIVNHYHQKILLDYLQEAYTVESIMISRAPGLGEDIEIDQETIKDLKLYQLLLSDTLEAVSAYFETALSITFYTTGLVIELPERSEEEFAEALE
ncbi:MAG: hypothetical protein Q9199_003817 [Rusavskia elegans]